MFARMAETATPLLEAMRGMMAAPHRPVRVSAALIETRELSSDNFVHGGALAGGRLLDLEPTPVRRPLPFAERLGVTFVPDLEGNQSVALPVQRGKATMRWRKSEGEVPTQTNPRQGQVVLYPEELNGWLDVNRQSLLQTGNRIEAYLRRELRDAVMEAVERVLLQGTGEGQPWGLSLNADIAVEAFSTSGTPTRSEVIDAIGACTAKHVARENIVAVVAPEFATAMRKIPVVANSDRFLIEGDMLAGTVRYEETAHCPADTMFLGQWSDVVVGMWDEIELMIDPYSRSTSGTVRMVANHTVGVGYRRVGDFVRAA